MASQNPQIYYEDRDNHGDYSYESLENLVNNFWQNFTGDSTILGQTTRKQILFWMKKGIQQFTFDALKEVKIVELELTDNLDIVLPPDYVEYVRISWLNIETGEYMPMSENRKSSLATSYLQDHEAYILFDHDGDILKGSSATELINNRVSGSKIGYSLCTNEQNFTLDTSINHNGTFNVDKRVGRIHFSSDNATRIIILEYISDGLEYSDEEDVKISKLAEMALYNWCSWNLLNNKQGVPDYEKRRAKKDFDTSYRNTKIKMLGVKIHEIAQVLKGNKRWIR